METTQATKETLHLFTDDDGNTYAARDLAHAKELWTADTGKPAEEAGEWTAIPDDHVVKVEDDIITRSLLAGRYAAEVKQPGCCGSFNY